jgi:hypothetical protein
MADKLINLGHNRFSFRPQIGVVHARGKWSFEATGAVSFFTVNDNFFDGGTFEQAPYFTFQGHVIHTFRPGFWARASVGYGFGGQTKVNGVDNNDRKGALAWSVSAGYPIAH